MLHTFQNIHYLFSTLILWWGLAYQTFDLNVFCHCLWNLPVSHWVIQDNDCRSNITTTSFLCLWCLHFSLTLCSLFPFTCGSHRIHKNCDPSRLVVRVSRIFLSLSLACLLFLIIPLLFSYFFFRQSHFSQRCGAIPTEYSKIFPAQSPYYIPELNWKGWL